MGNMAEMCKQDVCFQEFQRLILQHAVNDPPGQLALLTGSEARLAADFAKTTLFKHFLLYQYCISFNLELRSKGFTVDVERAAPPPKLELSFLKTKEFNGDRTLLL